MKTAKNDKREVNMDDAALTMAIAVISQRISALPKEDRDDLYDLTRIMIAAESDEEVESAKRAFREILDQTKGKVKEFCASEEPIGVDGWLLFISKRIKTAREAAKMTQEELERETGLPQSHISRLENGVHSPSSATLAKIAKATGHPVSYFDSSHNDE